MAQSKKHYAEETITLQNGDEVTAKNLPISKLKLFHKEFGRWSEHLKKQERLFEALKEEAETKAEGDEEKAQKILDDLVRKEEEREEEGLTYVDVASDCALIALQSWRVRAEKGITIDPDEIDLEYVQENIDMITLDRILQIAGAVTIGDVNELEGKPRG